ncbi:VOC family protein [Vulgatibacter sp.]|uniref:VOC family protein n=1 Tax=Vulgatibacter sp. TaxID=1971226 RepID=UPI003569055D
MTRLDSLTPLLIVDAIEPQLVFWCERLGFNRTEEVPDDGAIGFVILEKDGHTLMLQSRRSVEKDEPKALAGGMPRGHLFLVVQELDEVIGSLEGYEQVMERRTTFYGMAEVAYRDPAGNWITFAQQMATTIGPG